MNSPTIIPMLIKSLNPKNLLSFSPQQESIPLLSLNILIGPNGSGKSNLIDVISLIRSTPHNPETRKDLISVLGKGGGVASWIGKSDSEAAAEIDVETYYLHQAMPLRHSLSFRSLDGRFMLEDERVEEAEARKKNAKDVYFFYRYQQGNPAVNIGTKTRDLKRESVDSSRSILAQRRDPDHYPELTWLAERYEKIRIYRSWTFGREGTCRESVMADARNDQLEEDFSNIWLFINRLKSKFPRFKKELLEHLQDLNEDVEDFDFSTEGGRVYMYMVENGVSHPASRLSDGTLRYLCLLAILCDPKPPPLICIEEPELGLHPDIIPKLADLLKSAAQRTQLIITTHSDILLDAMTDIPETVIVCSKEDGHSRMKRLNPEELKEWLTKYRLGQLWTKGGIGGTRW